MHLHHYRDFFHSSNIKFFAFALSLSNLFCIINYTIAHTSCLQIAGNSFPHCCYGYTPGTKHGRRVRPPYFNSVLTISLILRIPPSPPKLRSTLSGAFLVFISKLSTFRFSLHLYVPELPFVSMYL